LHHALRILFAPQKVFQHFAPGGGASHT